MKVHPATKKFQIKITEIIDDRTTVTVKTLGTEIILTEEIIFIIIQDLISGQIIITDAEIQVIMISDQIAITDTGIQVITIIKDKIIHVTILIKNVLIVRDMDIFQMNAEVLNENLIRMFGKISKILLQISADLAKKIQTGSQDIHRILSDVIIAINQDINIKIVNFYQKTETKIIFRMITENQ